MREIKFRIYNTETKSFFGNDLREYINIANQIEVPEHLKVMEFIGLEDANGVPIYEGDIVTWDGKGSASSLYWSKRKLGWGLMAYEGLYDANMIVDMPEILNMIVIGNIYENPELLTN